MKIKIHSPLFALFILIAPSLDASAIDESVVRAAMNRPDRLVDDLARDGRSKPEVVIPLLNLEPGDRVVDIFGSGGYYSELLATVVGDAG